MSHLIFLKGHEVAFSLKQAKINELYVTIDIEILYTDYGLFIPFNFSSLTALDYLENGSSRISLGTRSVRGILVSSDTTVHEMHITGKQRDEVITYELNMVRVPYTKNTKYCRGSDISDEAVGTAALEIETTLPKIVELYGKVIPKLMDGYVYMNISDIAAELQKRKCTEFLPFKEKLKEK
jgi:hypothetical protein